MALEKTIQSDSGVSSDYWKINSVKIDYSYSSNVRIDILLDGYLNSQTRNDNYSPTTRKSYTLVNPIDFTVLCGTDGKNNISNNPLKVSYDYLKTLDEFQGSIDV